MHEEVFGTALNCMDGRAIRAVLEYFEAEHGILYPDMPTEPGVNGLMLRDVGKLDELRSRVVDISVGKHGSRIVAVVGHAECAGHPVEQDLNERDVHACLEELSSWDYKIDEPVLLVGLFVERGDSGRWTARELCRASALNRQNQMVA